MRRFVCAALVLSLGACSLFTAKNARGVLDVIQVACALENATLADADIATACGIANDLIPDLRTILASHRAGLAKARRAGACGPDAGADGGK